MKNDFGRIELLVGGYGDKVVKKIGFQGREIADDGHYTAFLTPQGNILIYHDLGIYGSYYKVYSSFSDITEEICSDGEPLYPVNILAEIAEEIGEKYIEELDI